MKKNGRTMFFVMIAGIVICAAARVFAISRTDMNTGLPEHNTALLCNLLYYVPVILAAVAAFVIAQIERSDPSETFAAANISAKGTAAIGFGMLLVAMCMAYEGIRHTHAISVIQMKIFTDFVFAAVMGIIAFVTLYKKEFTRGLGFCYVFGGVYFVFRGICCFVSHMVIVSIPEYFIESLSIIFGALFFAMLGKFLSGNEGKLTKAAFFGWSVGTAVLTLSAALGTLVAKLVLPAEISERIVFSELDAEIFFQYLGGSDAYQLVFPPLTHTALGILSATAAIAVCFSKRKEVGEQPL